MRPTPMNTPLLAWLRYESMNARMVSAVSTCEEKPLRNCSSSRLAKPNPRAMAKRIASIGMMASSVENVSADALFTTLLSINSLMERVTILMAPYIMPLFLLTSSSVTRQMSSNRKVLISLISNLFIRKCIEW